MTDYSETKMYGMTVQAIRSQYMNSLTAKFSGQEMVVMGILSDCQEMQAMNNPMVASMRSNEYVRKQLNVAKFILSEMMEQKESV